MHARVSAASINLASCPLRSGHVGITRCANVRSTMVHKHAANLWPHGYYLLRNYVQHIWVPRRAMHHLVSARGTQIEGSNSLISINELPRTTECSQREHLR